MTMSALKFRYQGAIVKDQHILLIRHQEHASGRDYWIIPGGGRIDGESEEQCVIREMKEETNLDVAVERLLLEEVMAAEYLGKERVYKGSKTYLCRIVAGEASPGGEPEPEAASHLSILARECTSDSRQQ